MVHITYPDIAFRDRGKSQIVLPYEIHWALQKAIAATGKKWVQLAKKKKQQERVNAREAEKKLQQERKKDNPPSKIRLLYDHFEEAAKIVLGKDFIPESARNTFYKIRDIILKKYPKITLNPGDFGRFTQEVLTYFHRINPLYKKIYLERRGFLYDAFHDKEIPLDTLKVAEYIETTYGNHVFKTEDFLSPELISNKALFIEKQGYHYKLKESGILKELQLQFVINSQGNGVRAAKDVIKFFNQKGIKVYMLHDFDMHGYNIREKLLNPSQTYDDPLEVIDLGINLEQVQRFGKDPEPQIVKMKKTGKSINYTELLKTFPEDVRDFFSVNPKNGEYQRVELNAFTGDELIQILREGIKKEPLIPPENVVESAFSFSIDVEQAFANVFEKIIQNHRQEFLKDTPETSRFRETIKRFIRFAGSTGKLDDRHWVRLGRAVVNKYEDRAMEQIETNIQQFFKDHMEELIEEIRECSNKDEE